MVGLPRSLGVGLTTPLALTSLAMGRGVVSGGVVPSTVLRRETDGSVTVVSIANTYTPILARQSDGSVIVGAA